MSDNLVKRARHNANADMPHHASVSLIEEMADRIEELEAELHTMKTAGVIEVAVRNPNVSEYITHWEGRAEGAEAKLAKVESMLVILVKFAEQSKATAGSGNSKRREHYRMHALSEALGQIRKIMKEEKRNEN